ncbi:ATP-dependent DNA helicase pcrA [uncultured Roseburia sp.]|nr:ATP-dependent DNA helicase pcrA [uncultured Roseburia sp.]
MGNTLQYLKIIRLRRYKRLLMEMNQAQKEAVMHNEGPMMVLAGPGSGKTFTIIQRIRYLINHYYVNPGDILVITFTKAAANEMKERFLRLMQGRKLPVTFGTFHAVYFMILKYAYGYKGSDIIKEDQKFQFMKQLAAKMRLDYEDENEFISSVLAEISMVKNSDIQVEHYYSTNCAEHIFRKVFEAYQKFLTSNHLIDFDDMLVFCKELFEQRKDILAGWQKRFPYILIDEFQDINQVQYDVIKMLADKTRNLFIVGDDDQSIYRFRGAKPEIMMHVEQDFPDIKKVTLNMNYRCPREVVSLSQKLIQVNSVRFPKEITAAAQEAGMIRNLSFGYQKDQDQYLAEEMRKLHKKGISYEEMVVLFRTNMQPRLLMEYLMRYNIPFRTRERIPNIYDHWIAKDLLCYINIALGSRQRKDFLQIMNRPKRYLSRESLPEETVAFDVWEDYYKEADWMVQRLEKLQMDLKVIEGMKPYSAVNYIRKGIDYESYLQEISQVRKIDYEELLEVLDELQLGAKNFTIYEAWFLHMEDVRRELNQQQKEQTEAVTLSTFHGVKGLEYDYVFITDINEGIIPYRKSVMDADIEEERRLFYVGMTRAKKELTLCRCGQINNRETAPSRFLEEIFGV